MLQLHTGSMTCMTCTCVHLYHWGYHSACTMCISNFDIAAMLHIKRAFSWTCPLLHLPPNFVSLYESMTMPAYCRRHALPTGPMQIV
jgi:hypothetical protein